MAIGDIKTFDIIYNGLRLKVVAIDNGAGGSDFQITCLEGSADVNALWWGDDDNLVEGNTTLVKSDSALNMNGTGEVWDGYAKLSSAGLGQLGWDKATALTTGETLFVNDVAVNWNLLNVLGVRATSTSTDGGSIKGVDDTALITKLPTISIGDAQVSEGGQAQFTITLSNAYPYDIVVSYGTANGSALATGDYTAKSGTLVIPAGQTTATVLIDTTEDGIFELTENFSVNVTAVADIPAALGSDIALTATDGVGTGTITDDEAQPTVSISNGTPNPATEGAGASVSFTVSLSGPADKDVTLTYSTVDGTAVAGGDFTGATNATVTILAGQTSATITVPVSNDNVFELTEAFSVALSGAVYDAGGANLAFAITDASGDAAIADDEAQPTVSISNGTPNPATEGAGASISFTVSLSGPADKDVTLTYSTVDGTAVAGSDFTGATNATVTILAGQTSATITVPVSNDNVFELTEAFSVALSGAVYDAGGANLAFAITDGSGDASIMDDDAKPSFAIADAAVDEDAGTITFTVTKTGATAVGATVQFQVNPGTAGTPADYSGVLSGELDFGANETTKTITLQIIDDTDFEATESFTVTLSNAVNATISDTEATGTIIDDDPDGPDFGPTLLNMPTPSNGQNPVDPTNNDNDSAAATSTTSGTVSGSTITLTAGNDTFTDTSSSGGGSRTISGLGGNDTIYAGDGGDTVNGGDGNDTLYGQKGDDTLNGGNDNDKIYGGSGNDTIDGGAGDDEIFGGSGDGGSATARGGSGNDTIYGGNARDEIYGDAGADHIYGGFGDDAIYLGTNDDGSIDTLHYLDLRDTNDSVSGFVSGQDKIDLSALDAILGAGNDAFAWAGQTPDNTARVAANSVSWYTSAGNVIVLADTDGDTSNAELMITLTGITSIDLNDFML